MKLNDCEENTYVDLNGKTMASFTNKYVSLVPACLLLKATILKRNEKFNSIIQPNSFS